MEQAALGEDFGEGGLPVEGFGVDGGVEDAQALEFVLPGFPEADEGLAPGSVEGGEVIGVGIGEGFAGVAGGVGFVLAAEGFEVGFEDAAGGMLNEVAGDEGGGIDGAFLFASVTGLGGLGS